MKILLVEDDPYTTVSLIANLRYHHFVVDNADNGQMGLELAESFDYDLILLDIMLPKLDGLSLCRQLRTQGNDTPILMLTAKNSSQERVLGLEGGADDYLVKPFNESELIARIHALLRRKQDISAEVLIFQNLQINIRTSEVTYQGKSISLTPKEYGILELLLRNPHRIYSRRAILDRVWTVGNYSGEEAVTTHIKGLRRKLKEAGMTEDVIETVYGFGYRLKDEPKASERKEENLPPTASSNSPSRSSTKAVAEVKAKIAKIWQQFKGNMASDFEFLEQLRSHLSTGNLDEQMRQNAVAIAHRLVGTLGTFGLVEQSEVARQIMRSLQAQTADNSEIASQLEKLVTFFQGEFEKQISETSILSGKTATQILIVGLELELAEALKTAASSHNWQIKVAPSFTVAQKIIAQRLPQVLLLDLDRTEVMEANLTFLAEVRGQYPHFPVLVLSEQKQLLYRLEISRRGIFTFIQKPISGDLLLETIAHALNAYQEKDATLMIVDDDPEVLAFLRIILEAVGFEVVSLSDSRNFWEVLETTKPDLLILDLTMPHFNGVELCEIVRNDKRFGNLPILFLSAHKDSQKVRQAFAVGADDYVTKPIIPEELVARVLNRLQRVRGRLKND